MKRKGLVFIKSYNEFELILQSENGTLKLFPFYYYYEQIN